MERAAGQDGKLGSAVVTSDILTCSGSLVLCERGEQTELWGFLFRLVKTVGKGEDGVGYATTERGQWSRTE